MSFVHLWVFVGLSFFLLLFPAISFLLKEWSQRRSDFFDSFTEDAMRSYFVAFHQVLATNATGSPEMFRTYYKSQFGRARFFWPIVLFAMLSGLLFCWCAFSVCDPLSLGGASRGRLPLLAISGAIMWIIYDEISRWYAADITPADVFWWSFRLVIAVPMGYAIFGIFNEKVGCAVAFLLGALPTSELISWAKRMLSRQSSKSGFTLSEAERTPVPGWNRRPLFGTVFGGGHYDRFAACLF
jgi:hypothetical protein